MAGVRASSHPDRGSLRHLHLVDPFETAESCRDASPDARVIVGHGLFLR